MGPTVKRRIHGVTILELIIACTILMVITLLGHMFISRSMEGLKRFSERSLVRRDMAKLTNSLRRDVEAMSFASIAVGPAESSLSGVDGDAIWGLSGRDLEGKFHLLPDGSPFWQNQILYYPTIRTDYQNNNYQGSGLASSGYEVSYPFKQVVRRVLDAEDPVDPADPSTIEALSPDLADCILRSTGLTVPGAPGTLQSRVVASNILEFRASTQVDNSIEFKISGYAPEMRPKALGSVALTDSPQTRTIVLRLYPKQSLAL